MCLLVSRSDSKLLQIFKKMVAIFNIFVGIIESVKVKFYSMFLHFDTCVLCLLSSIC